MTYLLLSERDIAKNVSPKLPFPMIFGLSSKKVSHNTFNSDPGSI
jgi:hypothetical protein